MSSSQCARVASGVVSISMHVNSLQEALQGHKSWSTHVSLQRLKALTFSGEVHVLVTHNSHVAHAYNCVNGYGGQELI